MFFLIIKIFKINFKVTFYKRAQILIADIWGCFEGTGPGFFAGMNKAFIKIFYINYLTVDVAF